MRCKEHLLEWIRDRIRKLYPLENQELQLYLCLKNWFFRFIGIMIGIAFFMIILCLNAQKEEYLKEGNKVERPSYQESSKEVQIKAKIEEAGLETEEITLKIEPEKYTFLEFETLVKDNIPLLEESILGNNSSLESVEDDLILPETLLGTLVEIRWESDNEDIISRTGKLNKDWVIEAQDDKIVLLTAIFTYEEYKISHTIGIKVKARELSEAEYLRIQLFSELEKVFETSVENQYVELPKVVNGKTVLYEEKKNENGGGIIFFFVAGIVLWGVSVKEELESMEKKREKQLLMDYPALISQFTLLLSAGMTISGAWKKIIDQYEMQVKEGWKKRRYVYEEMTITWREMQNGISEADAIGRFGTRICLVCYLKFATLLSQNIRKGSRGLISLLKVEEKLAYEERKEMAKQLGEEAGTKLLVPMFMMFGIVLAVILVPAFSNF